MFCNKCGKQLPDSATFCSGCGNQVGAINNPAPKAAPALSDMPPIISRLITQITNLFTKKDPVGVIANSAKDTSFSGLIIAVFGMLIASLAAMVNLNQGIASAARAQLEGAPAAYVKEIMKQIAKKYPSGATFGMTFLTVFLVFMAAVGIIYVVFNYVAKKKISISGACNLVAYSSIPVIAISILNMLFGLIWFVLPVFFMALALVVSTFVFILSVNKVLEEQNTFVPSVIIYCVIAVVAFIFVAISLKTINNSGELNGIEAYMSNWIYK